MFCGCRLLRFWTPTSERHQEKTCPTASTSMFDFRVAEVRDFRSKSPSPSLLSSAEAAAAEAEVDEATTTSRRKESFVARRCTRQMCCKYFRRFVAFLFSTVGSCCLMVGYVMLGGLIFHYFEHGRTVDIDVTVGKVKEKYLGWLWNLTKEMNILHPKNWSTVASHVLSGYTTEVSYRRLTRTSTSSVVLPSRTTFRNFV